MDTGTPKEVIFYTDRDGRRPFANWLFDLRDSVGRKRILARIHKLEKGLWGDREAVKKGVIELKMDFGPGYRIYVGEHGNKIVVLLGGDKDSQQKDIERARAYWQEYKEYNGI
jgi:putative addiction module killer protein